MTGKLTWKKSSHSGSQGNCVEVAELPGGSRAVRDSKDREGTVLRFGGDQWRAFVAKTKASDKH